MTDIKDLLDRASDVPVPVDVAGDLARGRAAVRRRRRLVGSSVVAGAVLVGASAVGVAALTDGGERASGSTSYATATTPPSVPPSGTPSGTPSSPPSSPPSGPPSVVPGQPVSPDLNQFYEVPPAPPGWFYFGQDQYGAIYAPDGAEPQMGDFENRLVVLFSKPGSGPGRTGQPVDHAGRTFYTRDGDSGYRSVWVEQDSGEWLSLQYPRSAGFSYPDMLDFLDAVKVTPYAISVG